MALKSGTSLPSFDGATEWLNRPVTSDELVGKPILVTFWAVSCYICKENLPTLKQWKETYGPQGVQFVSVHMPRQESDTDLDAVKAIAAQYEIDEPLAIDGYHEIGDRFETGGFWPYYLLFDSEGKLKSRAAGDVGLRTIEGTLKRLLEHPASTTVT